MARRKETCLLYPCRLALGNSGSNRRSEATEGPLLPWSSGHQALWTAGSSTPQSYWAHTLVYHLLGIWHVGPLGPVQEYLMAWASFLALCPHPDLHHRLLVSFQLPSALFSSRFPFGADPGQRGPGSELLFRLYPDEAQSLFCPGRGQPRGQAHWAPPPHGLQCQCRCLLLLHLPLEAWPWLHPLHGQWTMGAGREGFPPPFFFKGKT